MTSALRISSIYGDSVFNSKGLESEPDMNEGEQTKGNIENVSISWVGILILLVSIRVVYELMD